MDNLVTGFSDLYWNGGVGAVRSSWRYIFSPKRFAYGING